MIKHINKIFDDILKFAEENQTCKRKAVGCAAVTLTQPAGDPIVYVMRHNGPSRRKAPCTNEVGNCGCSHAEPRVVNSVTHQSACDSFSESVLTYSLGLILICTYSPCTNCANIIIDSNMFGGVIYDILTKHDMRGAKFLCDAMPVMTKEVFNNMTESEANDKIRQWISD